MNALAACIVAILAGSIPSGVVLSRTLGGTDVRLHGSGNIGAANVVRTSGFKVGALVGVLDILKGVLPVVLARTLDVGPIGIALVAVCAVLGHDYSLVLRFRGGKGVATTLGAILALAPAAAVPAMLVWVVVMLGSRYSSVASLAALTTVPLALALTGEPAAYVGAGFFLLLLGVWKHRENIGRLRRGEESKFRRSQRTDGH